MRRFFEIVLCLVLPLNLSAQTGEITMSTMMPKDNIDEQILSCFVEKEINHQRQKRGLNTLVHVDYFEKYAHRHSHFIAKNQKPEHSAIEADKYISGECIDMRAKMGFDDLCYGDYAKEIVQSWMSSPPHRKIILTKDLTEFGVGIAEGRYNYRGYKLNAAYSTLVVN